MRFIQHIISSVFFTILLLGLFTACKKKEISLPDPSLEKLFGRWEWVESGGGLAYHQTSPSTTGCSITIEFERNGIYKEYKNGKHQNRMKFYLSKGSSIYSSVESNLIKYNDTGILDKNNTPITESIQFAGQDTLYLNQECFDCFGHVYVRKK